MINTKNKIKVTRSKCCLAKIKTNHDTSLSQSIQQTLYYICTNCDKACDTVTIYIDKKLPNGEQNRFKLSTK